MSESDAATLVGETLIQVISETNTEEPAATPVLMSPPAPSPTLPSENLMDGSQRPPDLPDALLRLQNSGHHLQVVSCEQWNFRVDTIISSNDTLIGFDKAGIDIDDISSIRRRNSNNTWIVTFRSKVVKDTALNEQTITFAGCTVFLGDCENKVSIVKIFELPDELPDSVVIGRLSHYGRVISFCRDRVANAIFNGVRTARMVVERPIPNQAFIAGEYCRFWYPAQPKTCRKCGADDHLAATCKSTHCFNCERPGHRVEACDMPALCRVCVADSHETASCPFIYYSSNVTGAKPAATTYSGAVRNSKLTEEARKMEEQNNKSKREDVERARREEDRKKQEAVEKEREEKEHRREKERREKERREEERRDRHEKERAERERHSYDDRRYRDERDERDDRERDRDYYRSSRDRSSHCDYESDRSNSEDEGWTRVTHRKSKSR